VPIGNCFCEECKSSWQVASERENDFNPRVGADTPSGADATHAALYPRCPNCGARGHLMTPYEANVSETADLPAPDISAALRDRAEDLRERGL